MIEIISKGGIFIWPIIACSIIALAAIFERFITLQSKKLCPSDFLIELEELIKQNRIVDAKTLCKKNKSLIAQIISPVLEKQGHTREEIKTLLDEHAGRELEIINRPLQILNTIAGVGPLLGLLGTVSGIIKIFKVVAEGTVSNPALLSAGIGEALYTTAAGLIVAIPAYIAFKYFQSRAKVLALTMEEQAYQIMELIKK